MSNLSKKFRRKKKGKKDILSTLKSHKVTKLLAEAQRHSKEGRVYQARDLYLQILDQNPRNDQALHLLAKLYINSQEYPTALKYLLEAIKINPKSIQHHIALGELYCFLHQWDDAIKTNKMILEHQGDNPFALHCLGLAYRGKGQFEKSIPLFKNVIEIKPNLVDTYGALCSVYYRLKLTDDLLALLSKMESTVHSLNSVEQCCVYFSLGRYYDHLDRYDKSFSYLEKANKLKLGGVKYNPENDIAFMKRVSGNVTRQFLDRNKGYGSNDSSPIFIVGMPRSGTSLIEQILSCHPDVNAGGELLYFYGWATSIFDYSHVKESTEKLVNNYLQAIASVKKDSKYFTDKLPNNFLYAGLIQLCFPESKIIHCGRDPMDTCFSCYKQDFRGSFYYACDLLSLGNYYKAYEELMRHWHDIMPGRILDVKYENVVKDVEKEVRRILEYCSLPWNDDCLQFYNSPRFVETASRDQVAQPIYSSSVGRWKHYMKHLLPLSDVLNKQV